jgi:tryptophan-rich sensory protein
MTAPVPSTAPLAGDAPTALRHPWLGLAGWLLVTVAASATGAVASARSATFYAALDRPAWAPPGWLFGPVWTGLYLAMAIAAWLVWRARGWRGARGALTLYLVQLVPNALWTWAFFERRSGLWATVDVVAMLVTITATMIAFRRVRLLAAGLLVPYLAWVAFATALTVAVWRLNPETL